MANPKVDVELKKARIEICRLHNLMGGLEEDNLGLQNTVGEYAEQADGYIATIDLIETEIARLRRVNCALQAEFAKRQKAVQAANRGIARINEEKWQLTKTVVEQNAKIAHLAAELQQGRANAAFLEGKCEAYEDDAAFFQKKVAEQRGELNRLSI